ncbi:phenolphthiocerol synthesis polyketide synthase type I Pks15/1 [Antarctobacter heliothermus]|uniref:Phenolphthiocerol synthesis polyketide synthase type I Pks15/1 n=1 Tax=Antarctobacter heliothermus TaxID=74033 RepID=A0A222E7R6_9RHOB|nr:type I polyketide synthase [Antarctobacter heliothermus]ASP22068.1 phenolphthiocerol synthesis polyketide synthase type I Pks15/1 [Antarctobacter heliothermus]
MTAATDQMKRALHEIRRLRGALDQATLDRAERSAIAIVGTGLRLPGGISSLPQLEEALRDGRNLVTPVPPARWNGGDLPGDMTSAAGYGAFIEDVDLFDPEFFGISGAEAASMDPQQRLLLETGWEALEDAGHAPDSFAERALGIFIGMANSDYGRMMLSDIPAIDPYFTSGSSFSVAAGRLSYFLGTTGPAITVDTACSSSLVALHLARRALVAGECDVALAGGVNLMLSPEVHVNFDRAGMLAGDGRCKTFDAAADGYVRGEGCVVLALRRLEDAQADGDRILAVIRGSAVNQDGRSNGLTAPNGRAQEVLIRAALEDAGLTPGDVGYVEAHGTGTSLGDPIEMEALGRAYARDRADAPPLVVGSVKTNLGHLESAAGAAGVLKTLVALRSGRIPAHLNFDTPNPYIGWQNLRVRIPTETEAWPDGTGRFAGVSSFGFSGTNAHLILGPAPEAPRETTPGLPWHLFTMSAKSDGALQVLGGNMAEAMAESAEGIADICHTVNAGRARMPYRLSVAVRDRAELAQTLRGFGSGLADPAIATGLAQPGQRPKIGFLFTGQGAQHPGMGRALYETQPVYRRAIDACAEALGNTVPGGLVAALHDTGDESRIRAPGIAQPALFALEYALARLWMSFGLKPDAVCGHSLGEFAAATIAGMMPLEDALMLVAERGRLTAQVAAEGMMAGVFAPRDAIQPLLDDVAGVGIAAYNTPRNHVLSGPEPALRPVLDRLTAQGFRVEPLHIAFAAHCPLVDPVLEQFRAAAGRVRHTAPRIPLVSNLTGDFVPDDGVVPDHWANHLRQPVRFADGVATLLEAGITHFVEIGPHPVLSGMAAECAELSGVDRPLHFLASLRRNGEDGRDLCESLGQLFVDGAAVNPDALQTPGTARRVALPTYPFERARHWHPSARPGAARMRQDPENRWARFGARLSRECERGPLGFDAAACPGAWTALADLTRARIVSLLRDAGLFGAEADSATVPKVVAELGALPDFAPLVERWLLDLAATGTLRRDGARFSVPDGLADPDLSGALARAEAALSGNAPLMDYVRHCTRIVGAVIRGEVSPLETLFPDGDFALALGLYEGSATMRYMNGLAAAAVEAIADSAGPELRVIEAGAGTGGTTAAVLEALAGRSVQYVFTDVSDLFLDRAQARFSDREGMAFARLDLETAPAEQGFARGSFDLVLASNAVHAVRNLPETLGHLRGLLRPGGVLVLIESTEHFTYFNITTGLIEGWRHAEDTLRSDDLALIDAPTWTDALTEAGFDKAESWPRAGTAADTVGQHLIVARAPLAGVPQDETATTKVPAFQATAPQATDPALDAAMERIAGALPRERARAISELVRIRVMRLLRRNADQPPLDHERLLDLGLDSLMAVQLRNTLAQDLGLTEGLPATLVFDHPTIIALAAYLDSMSAPSDETTKDSLPPPTPRANGPVDAGRAKEIEAMSEEEVEALLLERLKQ